MEYLDNDTPTPEDTAMANIEHDPDSGFFRIRFWYGGRQFKRSLKTDNERKAKAAQERVEEMIELLERGRLEIPPGVDPGKFIVTEGRMTAKPVAHRVVTLSDLFDLHAKMLPLGARENSTGLTDRIHRNHLLRHLGPKTGVQALTAGDLQHYSEKRSKDKWRGKYITATTIKKEIETFRAVWNWAVELKYLTGPAPVKGLKYPKAKEKPPFQTWDEIKRAIDRNHLTKAEQRELWDSLFLTVPQIGEVLAHVDAQQKLPAFVHPMLVFVAHTGARRSEMLRSRIDDFNLTEGTVVLREKKKDKSKELTFRHSFASNLAAKGVDQRVIDGWMGHQTEEMRRRYRHLFPDQRRKAIERSSQRRADGTAAKTAWGAAATPPCGSGQLPPG
jgi:integrase